MLSRSYNKPNVENILKKVKKMKIVVVTKIDFTSPLTKKKEFSVQEHIIRVIFN